MCGIVGYVGREQAAPILLEGLSKLEYRGYDSAGVCVFDGGELKVAKAKGRLRGKSPKLTPRQEAHLVQLHAADEHTVGEMAELFSVGRSTVYRALQRAERGRENALQ